MHRRINRVQPAVGGGDDDEDLDADDFQPLLARGERSNNGEHGGDPSEDFERLTRGFQAEIVPAPPNSSSRSSVLTYDSRSYRALDDALDRIGEGPFQYRLLALTAFGHFIEAAEYSMLGLMLPLLAEDFHTTSQTELALIGSLTGVGMIFGTGFFAQLSNQLGRRVSYQTSLTICVLFGVVSSFCTSVTAFALARGGLGFGYGGNLVASTTLLMEFTPTSQRARYMNISGIAYGMGAVFVVGLGWGIVPIIGWRWLLRIVAILSLPVVLSLPFLPESPRFYIMRKRAHEAVAVVHQVAQTNSQPFPAEASVDAFSLYNEPMTVWSQAVRLREYWRTTVPLCLVWFSHSLASGINLFIPLQLSQRDPSDANAKYGIALAMSLGCLAGNTILLFTSSYFGRLSQLKIGLLCTAIWTAVLGFDATSPAYIYVIATLLSMCSMFPICMLYLYTPETSPTETRTLTFALCHFFHRLAPVFSPFVVATLTENNSFLVTCFVFGGIYFTSFLLSLLLRVETFGRRLVECDDIASGLAKKSPPSSLAAAYDDILAAAGGKKLQPLYG